MIRRINEWIKRYSRSATLIILLPIFFIVFLVEEDYFLAVIFFAGWFFLVRNLVVYVKTDEKETKNYIMESVEIDENGRKHRVKREYNEQGEAVASTDFIGKND